MENKIIKNNTKLRTKKIVLSSIAMAAVLAVLGGFASTSLAATGTTGQNTGNYSTTKITKIKKHVANPSKAARLAAMKAKQAAIKAALEASDYNAWLAAVGANSAITKKINATNFPQLVQIYQLNKQILTLKTGLGINNGSGWNLGEGMGK